MKVAIFGGSFDPVHNGHVEAAQLVLDQTEFEEVWFMPCFNNPLKQKVYASPEHRLEMLRLAAKGMKNAVVSDFEVTNKIPYTAEVLMQLKRQFPRHHFAFVLGSDLAKEFLEGWRMPKLILTNAKIILIAISKSGWKELLPKLKNPLLLEKPTTNDISSSKVRTYIKKGRDISKIVPAAVTDYIESNALYK